LKPVLRNFKIIATLNLAKHKKSIALQKHSTNRFNQLLTARLKNPHQAMNSNVKICRAKKKMGVPRHETFAPQGGD